MGNPSNNAAAVVAAEVPNGKAGMKREAQDEIEKALSAKKQKAAPPAKAVPPPKDGGKELIKKQPPPKKVESSSSEDESCSEEESESESEEEEPAKKLAAKLLTQKPTAPLKKPVVTGSKKEESDGSGSDSDEDSDEGEEEASDGSSESESDAVEEAKTANAAQPAMKTASSKRKEDSSDEEPTKKKQKDTIPSTAPKVVKKESSSDEEDEDDSDDESDEEEPAKTPKKEAPALTSEKQEPRTPVSTQSQAKGSKTLFMGNIHKRAQLNQVREFLKEAGEVIDVRFPLGYDGTRKGFGYVQFASVEAAQKAIKFNGREFLARPVKLDFATEKDSYTPQSGKDTGSPATFTVFIKGFDKSLAEEQIRSSLQQHFNECGEITRVSIPTDNQTGEIKGIAYIDFEEQDSLSKALKLSGSELDGFELCVERAIPRGDNRGGRGGQSGGRFEGGSGGRRGGGRSGGGGRFCGRSSGRGGRGSGGGGRFGGRSSGRGGRGFANS